MIILYFEKKTLENLKSKKIIKLKFMIYVVTRYSGFIRFQLVKQLLKKLKLIIINSN